MAISNVICDMNFTNVFFVALCFCYRLNKIENSRAIQVLTKQATLSSLIHCQNLTLQVVDKLILDNISCAISKGSFTALIGPNGAGKSSLLRCLYRYLMPSSGTVFFQNQDVWQISANDYARQVAVVLQEAPSQFHLTVTDVVALGLVPYQDFFGRIRAEDKIKIAQAIEQVGLADKAQQSFEHLSGGEKQRALIARAIVQSPQLLIMDEPTSHLDIKYQIQIMELAKSLGITVIASFHDLNLASAMSDNMLVLKKGKLVADGKPSDVLTADLLSDVFGVCAQVDKHPQADDIPHVTYFYGYQREVN